MVARRKRFVTRILSVPEAIQRYCIDFNAGRFYEAHEHLEEVWQFERGPVRDCYKGLIQAAAAGVHLQRGGYGGARRLLRTAAAYIEPYLPGPVMGLDIEDLAGWLADASATLERLGPDGIGQFPLDARPRLAADLEGLRRDAVRWRAWGFAADGTPLPMEVVLPG